MKTELGFARHDGKTDHDRNRECREQKEKANCSLQELAVSTRRALARPVRPTEKNSRCFIIRIVRDQPTLTTTETAMRKKRLKTKFPS